MRYMYRIALVDFCSVFTLKCFQIIVVMPDTLKDHGLFLEALTRARKTFICVTTVKSSFVPLLKSSVEHCNLQHCTKDDEQDSCAFTGSSCLLTKDKVTLPNQVSLY